MCKKIVAIGLLLSLLLCAATSCNLLPLFYFDENGLGRYDDADQTAVNQEIKRSGDWKQIVEKSSFELGDRVYFEENYFATRYGTYPNIDGSTVTIPMSVEFARQHLGLADEDATEFVFHNTTHDAYLNLINRYYVTGGYMENEDTEFICADMYAQPVDIILVTEPSQEELALAKEKKVDLTVKPVCFDAFVFITHHDNPVDSLTVEQVQKIYTGEITNWKELGGRDEEIVAYQREPNSGSQTTMEQQVMQDKDMLQAPQTKVIEGMGGLVNAVAEYKNETMSIGYTFKYYIDTLYANDKIKTIQIDGIAPSNENIRARSYPFTSNYYAVIRTEDKNKTGGRFLDWMLGEEGQACIEMAGYCTLQK